MPAAPVHHTAIDDTESWDGPAAEKAFDKKAGDFVKFYAWVDEGESDKDATGTDKEDGWGPHHDVDSEGVPGDANLKGVEAAMAALNGAHGGNSVIPSGDRQGVWDHLAAHYKDAGIDPKDIPELKSAAPSNVSHRKPRQRRELGQQAEVRVLHTRPLEVRQGSGATDGLVELTGQVIVYGTPYEVYDMFGSFSETIHYGAAASALAGPLDVRFMVNHKDMALARTGAKASLTLTDTPEALCISALVDPRMSVANDLIVAAEMGTITQMSVGMVVDPNRDVWSGEDDYGMPNVRDIFGLSEILDTSAVTFPASPTTSIELAERMWSGVPVATRERTRRLWSVARDIRSGRSVSQSEADSLMHVLEQLHTVDTYETPTPVSPRNAPTAQDANISKAITAAHQAVAAALSAQSKDPDNNTDPVDKKVLGALQSAQDALTTAMQEQGKDGAPDKEQTNSSGEYQGDPDGTNTSSSGFAPQLDNSDGLGSRSRPPATSTARRESSMSFGDQQSLVYTALLSHLGDQAADAVGEIDIWIRDLASDWVVWHSYGTKSPGPGDWKLSYAMDADGVVTFVGDPSPVVEQTTFAPAPESKSSSAQIDRMLQIDQDLLRLSRPPVHA